MPMARAPTPIFRNCAPVVPTFDVLRKSCAEESDDTVNNRIVIAPTFRSGIKKQKPIRALAHSETLSLGTKVQGALKIFVHDLKVVAIAEPRIVLSNNLIVVSILI